MGVNDEFDLIHQYFEPLSAGAPGARGLLDDAATLSPSQGCELVVTMDTVVAGVHYLADEKPTNIVAKLMGSNLSDLAAMGATPRGFTLSCAWPKDIERDDIQAFAHAMGVPKRIHFRCWVAIPSQLRATQFLQYAHLAIPLWEKLSVETEPRSAMTFMSRAAMVMGRWGYWQHRKSFQKSLKMIKHIWQTVTGSHNPEYRWGNL